MQKEDWMKLLQDKVAVLTGAAGGIGVPIARALVAEGAQVLLTDVDADGLAKLAAELGSACTTCVADLADEDAPGKIIAECSKRFGRLDILINNAGIASRKPILEVQKDELMRHFLLNAYVPLAMAQAAVPLLVHSGAGEIITMSSVAGLHPYEGQAAYCASKHAQRALMEILTMELFPMGIRVHTLAPSGVDTEMIGVTRPDLDGDACSKPEEIAEIVLFILTHRNNSVLDEIYIRRHAKPPFEP
jgi:NADP-dependent 3-hydroxy acid dehydrogenase YdfG